MDNLLTVTFEAHNFEKNHHRRYAIRIGRDLFDAWTLTIGHGRCGQAGHETRFASSQVEAMQRIVSERLRRRSSAPTRIGCHYKLASLDIAQGFDLNAWLPDEVIAPFFGTACNLSNLAGLDLHSFQPIRSPHPRGESSREPLALDAAVTTQ